MPQNKVPGWGTGSCVILIRYARNPDSTLANDPDYADKAYTKQGSIVADTPEEVETQFADLRRYWDPKQKKPAKTTFFHLETSFSPDDPKSTVENAIEFRNRFYDQPETRDWMHTTDLHLNRPHLHFHDAVNIMTTSGKRIRHDKICQRLIWPVSDRIAKDMGMKIIPPKLKVTRNVSPLEAQASLEGKELMKTECRQIVTTVLKEASQRRIKNVLSLRDILKDKEIQLIRSSHKGGLAYGYKGYYFPASSLGGASFQLGALDVILMKGYEEGLAVIEGNLKRGKKMSDWNKLVMDDKYFELNIYSKSEEQVDSKLDLEDALGKLRKMSSTLDEYKEELSTLGIITRGNDDFTYEYEGLRTTQFQLPNKFHRNALEKYFEEKSKGAEAASTTSGRRSVAAGRRLEESRLVSKEGLRENAADAINRHENTQK